MHKNYLSSNENNSKQFPSFRLHFILFSFQIQFHYTARPDNLLALYFKNYQISSRHNTTL